jgi:hypothetical protein
LGEVDDPQACFLQASHIYITHKNYVRHSQKSMIILDLMYACDYGHGLQLKGKELTFVTYTQGIKDLENLQI